jgi:hypothetical protein
MSATWQGNANGPRQLADMPQTWPFAGPGEAAAPAAHVAGRCWCSAAALHSPLEMAALNAAPKVLTARPDKIERHQDFAPLSRSARRHNYTGAASATAGQADLLESRPEQRVRRMLGEANFEAPPPPKAPSLLPEMYSTGDLAEALGMSDPGVVRRWIREGLLEDATSWTAGGAMTAGIKGHASTSQKRRYSQRQFAAVVKIAIEEKVAHRSVTGYPRVLSIRDTEFPRRVREAFERIAKDEATEADNSESGSRHE